MRCRGSWKKTPRRGGGARTEPSSARRRTAYVRSEQRRRSGDTKDLDRADPVHDVGQVMDRQPLTQRDVEQLVPSTNRVLAGIQVASVGQYLETIDGGGGDTLPRDAVRHGRTPSTGDT